MNSPNISAINFLPEIETKSLKIEASISERNTHKFSNYPLKVDDEASKSFSRSPYPESSATEPASPTSTFTGETSSLVSSEHNACSSLSKRRYPARDMPMDFWVRTEECKIMKSRHLDYIDDHYYSREQFIEDTVFFNPSTGEQADIVLEPNMFPYQTPPDVEHWTLWSRNDMSHEEIEKWVNEWLFKNKPHVHHWNYDDNAGDRSILWFHVHVYLQYDDISYVRPRLSGSDIDQKAEERSHLKRSRRSRSRAVSPNPYRRRRQHNQKTNKRIKI